MRNVLLLARKDVREAFGRRLILLRLAIPSVLLPVLYGGLTGYAIRDAAHNPRYAAAMLTQVPMFAAIVVLLGSLIAVMVTADAIAGEKERRTIETLFATPISDREVFIGKLLAGLLPAIVIGYAGGLIFFVTARVTGGPLPVPAGPLLATARILLGGVPVIAAVLSALGVIISARCGSVTVATQLSSFASTPIMGLLIYIGFRISGWSGTQLAALLLAFVLLFLILLLFGARALNREEIVARLD